MPLLKSIRILPLVALSALCVFSPAMAADPAMPNDTPASSEPQPLDLTSLDGISAGASVTNVISHQDLTATNSGNTVNAQTVDTGDITFSGNALTGYAGVGNFVSNTGNNNNLQGTISINIAGVPGAQ